MVLTYMGTCSVYTVFIAESTQQVTNSIMEWDFSVRMYVLFVLPFIIAMGQIRSLKLLVPFSAISNVLFLIVFGVGLYYMFSGDLMFNNEARPWVASFGTMPLFFSTVVFAMEGIGTILPIENNMKFPQHFLGCPGVLNVAMCAVVSLYAAIGFFGYARWGNEVGGSFTLNFPHGNAISQMVQYMIGIAILFTYGLQFYVPIDIIWKHIKDRISPENHTFAVATLRAGIVLFLATLAIIVPNLEPFIGLVGAIFFSTLGMGVPCILETVLKWPNEFGWMKWTLWKNLIVITFSIFAAVSGASVSIAEIIRMYTEPVELKETH